MKEKMLMGSFTLAGLTDIAVSKFAISSLEEFKEMGMLAKSLTEQGNFDTAAILRMGFTAVLVGSYALSKTVESRLAYSYEQSLKIANVIAWGANALNIAQVAYHLYEKSI